MQEMISRRNLIQRAGKGFSGIALASMLQGEQPLIYPVVDGQAMPAFKASGDITSMSQADGYIEIPAQTDIVEKGEIAEVKLF